RRAVPRPPAPRGAPAHRPGARRPVSVRTIHMVGIGGAGMSALARLGTAAGHRVGGTDRDDSPALAALRAFGVDARAGHAADAVPDPCDAVVVSSAVSD